MQIRWGVASGVQTGRHEPSHGWRVVNSMHASYGLASDTARITSKRLRTPFGSRPKDFSNNHRRLMQIQHTTPLPHISQLSVLPNRPICSLSHVVTMVKPAFKQYFSIRADPRPPQLQVLDQDLASAVETVGSPSPLAKNTFGDVEIPVPEYKGFKHSTSRITPFVILLLRPPSIILPHNSPLAYPRILCLPRRGPPRSEERRVGKECSS